jgi:hypothetical protein
MAKLVLRRKGATLYAPSQDWADLMAELPEGVDLNVSASKARSLSQLGTYWATLAFAIGHGPESLSQNWPGKDELSDFLQLEVGFVRHIAMPTEHGPIYVRVPASKSFGECSQERFNAFFQLAMDRLAKLCEFDVLEAYLRHMAERGRRVA